MLISNGVKAPALTRTHTATSLLNAYAHTITDFVGDASVIIRRWCSRATCRPRSRYNSTRHSFPFQSSHAHVLLPQLRSNSLGKSWRDWWPPPAFVQGEIVQPKRSAIWYMQKRSDMRRAYLFPGLRCHEKPPGWCESLEIILRVAHVRPFL